MKWAECFELIETIWIMAEYIGISVDNVWANVQFLLILMLAYSIVPQVFFDLLPSDILLHVFVECHLFQLNQVVLSFYLLQDWYDMVFGQNFVVNTSWTWYRLLLWNLVARVLVLIIWLFNSQVRPFKSGISSLDFFICDFVLVHVHALSCFLKMAKGCFLFIQNI